MRVGPHLVRISHLRAGIVAARRIRRERPAQRPACKERREATMIPGPFSYHRPESVGDTIKLLSSLGEEARPLAGGHSLIPMMKLRLPPPRPLPGLFVVGGAPV